MRTLQDQVLLFRLISLNQPRKNERKSVIAEATFWLKSHRERSSNAMGLGIRWERARAYENLAKHFAEESEVAKKKFLEGLDVLRSELERFTAKHQAAFAGLSPACAVAVTSP